LLILARACYIMPRMHKVLIEIFRDSDNTPAQLITLRYAPSFDSRKKMFNMGIDTHGDGISLYREKYLKDADGMLIPVAWLNLKKLGADKVTLTDMTTKQQQTVTQQEFIDEYGHAECFIPLVKVTDGADAGNYRPVMMNAPAFEEHFKLKLIYEAGDVTTALQPDTPPSTLAATLVMQAATLNELVTQMRSKHRKDDVDMQRRMQVALTNLEGFVTNLQAGEPLRDDIPLLSNFRSRKAAANDL